MEGWPAYPSYPASYPGRANFSSLHINGSESKGLFTWKEVPLGCRGTLLCRVNDTGVLYEKFSQGGGALSLVEPRANNWRSGHWAPKPTTQTKIFCFLWSPWKLLWSLFLPWFCVVVVFVRSSEASLDHCRQYRSLGLRKTVLRSLLHL